MIDTVDLYFLRNRQRRLSLRFLSWYVLGENIQTDTHDSIEDAWSALRLYKAFQEFEERGVFDEKLDELYREGRQYVSLAASAFYCADIVESELEASTASRLLSIAVAIFVPSTSSSGTITDPLQPGPSQIRPATATVHTYGRSRSKLLRFQRLVAMGSRGWK